MSFKILLYIVLLAKLSLGEHAPKGLVCKVCEAMQRKITHMAKSKRLGIIDLTVKLCQIGLSADVCKYFVNSFANDLFLKKPEYILETNYICSHIFDYCDVKTVPYDFEKFRRDFFHKYPVLEKKAENKGPAFSMLVLNDIHIQNDYAYKANTDCGEPGGCCSNYHKPPRRKEHEAGYWGTLNKMCDIPARLFDKTVQYIKENLDKPDFLVVLGDNYGHNYFRTSEEELLQVNKYIYDTLKDNFKDTIILPVLGNHECHPVDHLDFNDPENFVYQRLYPIFGEFIGDDKINQLKERGYYALTYPEYKIKVIHLNTQMKDMFNTKLMVDNTNPLGFFDVIGDEFYQSEQKGEKVLVLTHIPIGDIGSIGDFGKNFKIVVERFADTIVGVLSGHTHNDGFVFLKNSSDEVVGVNYVSPSLTTYSSGNPSFRVYQFNDQMIEDYTQYILDLNEHNERADQGDYSFSYQINYRFKESYQLSAWGDFAAYSRLHDKIFNNKTIKHFYTYNYVPKVSDKNDYVPEESILCTTLDDLDSILACNKETAGLNFGLFIQQLFRYIFVEPWRSPVASLL